MKKLVVKSPGRVNIIGEHTDYALGYVMPAAVNLYTILEGAASEVVKLESKVLKEVAEFDLSTLARTGDWGDYVKGIYYALGKRGIKAGGLEGIVSGNLPIGAGLGSSASLELAVLYFLNQVYSLGLSRIEMALIAKEAENEFVGIPCGILDQFSSSMGRRGHVIFLDTETLRYEYVPISGDTAIAVFYTGIKREIGKTAYRERRSAVEEGLRMLGVRSSKYLDSIDLAKLPMKHKRYLSYIVRENERVIKVRDLLKSGDVEAVGAVLVEAHRDLATNYGVSCPELDFIVREAVRLGAYGARLTGAGFGGSVIILASKDEVEFIAEGVLSSYVKEFPWSPKYFIVEASDGVKAVERIGGA